MDRSPYALDVIRSWPDVARQAAHQVLLVHRAPHEVASDALCWIGIGPWERVVVRAGDPDADPEEAVEWVVEAVVAAEVPADRRAAVDEVAAEFRVRIGDGELAVFGRDLASNVVTLNALHALVTGELTVDEARARRAGDLDLLRSGRSPTGAETLRFADDAPCGEPRLLHAHRLATHAG